MRTRRKLNVVSKGKEIIDVGFGINYFVLLRPVCC